MSILSSAKRRIVLSAPILQKCIKLIYKILLSIERIKEDLESIIKVYDESQCKIRK